MGFRGDDGVLRIGQPSIEVALRRLAIEITTTTLHRGLVSWDVLSRVL